jgi:hypothetical protein
MPTQRMPILTVEICIIKSPTQSACQQVHLWRLPEVSASTGNSSDLVGAVTTLGSTQPWDGQELGSLAWVKARGAAETQLLVAGDMTNSKLALYAIEEGAAELQHLQVQRSCLECARCGPLNSAS